jgi:hypothetical protein
MTAAERVDSWACWFVGGEAGLPAASVPATDREHGPPPPARRAVARIRLARVAFAASEARESTRGTARPSP